MVTPCRPPPVHLGGAGSARSDGRVGIVFPDSVDLASRRSLLSQLIIPPAIASNNGPTSATRRSSAGRTPLGCFPARRIRPCGSASAAQAFDLSVSLLTLIDDFLGLRFPFRSKLTEVRQMARD
jgi:hypothetical protein